MHPYFRFWICIILAVSKTGSHVKHLLNPRKNYYNRPAIAALSKKIGPMLYYPIVFSPAAGSHGHPFDRKRDFGFATSHWRMKKRISNVEGRNSMEIYGFERQSAVIPSFNILRFDILLFCGSRFGHAESHTRIS
jgi:hypothetical protein